MPFHLPWWWPRMLVGLALLPPAYLYRQHQHEAAYPVTLLTTRVLGTGEALSTTVGHFPNPNAFTVPLGLACLTLYKGSVKNQQVRSLHPGACPALPPNDQALNVLTDIPAQRLTLQPRAIQFRCRPSNPNLLDPPCEAGAGSAFWWQELQTDQGAFEFRLSSAQILPSFGKTVCATVQTVKPPSNLRPPVKVVTGLQAAPCTT